MTSELLYKWFETPRGRILRHNESLFLRRSLTVSSMQLILQIGYLGWEKEFFDGATVQRSIIIDTPMRCQAGSSYVAGQASYLPFETESVDFILLPHFLEFTVDFLTILDEVDRVLKPEGEVIIVSFNPWSWFAFDYVLARTLNQISPPNRALSRSQFINKFLSLNYEIETIAGFDCREHYQKPQDYRRRAESYFVTAYALRGIKRCNNIIKLVAPDKRFGVPIFKPI